MELNVSEALRYLGVRGAPDPPLLSQLSAAADRLARAAPPRWVWRAYPLAFGPEGPALEGAGLALPGEMAARMLASFSPMPPVKTRASMPPIPAA